MDVENESELCDSIRGRNHSKCKQTPTTHSTLSLILAAPVARYHHIDATRGVALFLILLSHCIQSFFSTHSQSCLDLTDRAISAAFSILVHHKSMMMFAFLFGLSFYFQMKKATGQGVQHPGFQFCIRLLWLACFGLLNSLCDRYDMLIVFAVYGLCLPLCNRISTQGLVLLAVFFLIHPVTLLTTSLNLADYAQDFIQFAVNASQPPDTQASSWRELALWNITSRYPTLLSMLYKDGRGACIIGMFLLGQWAGKSQLLLPCNRERLVRWSGILLLLLPICYGIWKCSPQQGAKMVFWFLESVQAIIYIFICSLIFQSPWFRPATHLLSTIGKCTLSCYIMQGVLLSYIMYSWGIGLAESQSITTKAITAVFIFLFQLAFCHTWLRFFTCGPLEQIWHHLILCYKRKQGTHIG